jgi:hypothetical protein
MSRVRLLALLGALVLVTAPTAAGSAPRIWPATPSRLVVAGRGFVPHERVKVTVTAARGVFARSVPASATGSFRVRFVPSVDTRCGSAVAIAAVGSRGSRAFWKPRGEECPPPADPGQ